MVPSNPSGLRANHPISFAADIPKREPSEDRFGRWPFCQRIAQTIESRRDPSNLVIGIYGAWGEGKTTALNFIEHALRAHSQIIPVHFNPWRIADERELLSSFYATLAKSIEARLKNTSEEIGAALKKYGGFLEPLGVGGMRDVGNNLAHVALPDLRNRISNALRDAGVRVVVFLDDIDRLDKTEVQSVFRLVKLSADFENTVYVLAFDRAMVAAALQERFASTQGRAGSDFLEKIITVPLQLPPASQRALLQVCVDGVNEAIRNAGIESDETDRGEFSLHFGPCFLPRLRTPRIAMRYVNALLFALPLMKREVHPIDQIFIEGIRVFYPSLYEHIREHPDLYLKRAEGVGNRTGLDDQARAERDQELAVPLQGQQSHEKKAAGRVVDWLFPLARGRGGQSDAWASEQRVCSEHYFRRYFAYAVDDDDISDIVIKDVVARAQREPTVEQEFRELLERHDARLLIEKLRLLAKELQPPSSSVLALSLAMLGEYLSEERHGIDWSTAQHAAMLIFRLTESVSAAERLDEAFKLLAAAQPLWFAGLICSTWIEISRQEREQEPDVLSRKGRGQLLTVVAKRVRLEAEKVPPHVADPKHASILYRIWAQGRSKRETNKYLALRLSHHPKEVMALLTELVPTMYSSLQVPTRGDFGEVGYKTLASYLDPDTALRALVSSFGADIVDAEHPGRREFAEKAMSFEETVARQFAAIHRQALEKQHDTPYVADANGQE